MNTGKPIYELSLQEQAELLEPVIAGLQQGNLEKGLYNIYQDGRSKDLLIHDYRDRVEQVRVNAATGQTRTVKRVFKK